MTTKNKDEGEETTFDIAINLTGFGKYNLYLMFACGLIASCILLIGLDMSYTLTAAVCDLELSSSSKAVMSSSVFLGTISSSHLSGLLIDVLGRQYVMVRSLFITTCLHALTSIAPNFITFAILKTLIGFVLCASAVAVFTYIGESCPGSKTAFVIMLTTTVASSGFMYSTAIAWLILPGEWSVDLGFYIYNPWRLFFLINTGLPLLISTILLGLLPESPKFVLACGNKDKALDILRMIYRTNTGNSKKKYPVKRLADMSQERVILAKNPSDIIRRMWSQTFPLFLPPYLTKVMICSFIYFNIYFILNGVLLWVPEMTNRMAQTKSRSPNQMFTLCEMMATIMPATQEFVEPATPYPYFINPEAVDIILPGLNDTFPGSDDDISYGSDVCVVDIKEEIFLPNMLMGLVQPVGFCLVSFIVPLFKKKTAILLFLIIACVIMISITLIPYIKVIMTIFTLMPIVVGVVYNVITSLTVDFFPTNYRGMAVSLSMMFGRLGSIFGNFAFSFMLDSSCHTMFYIFAGILFCGCIVTLLIKSPKTVEVPPTNDTTA